MASGKDTRILFFGGSSLCVMSPSDNIEFVFCHPNERYLFLFFPATHLRIQFKEKYTRKSDPNANHLWDPRNSPAAKFSPLRSFGRTPIRISVRYARVADTRRNCFVGSGGIMRNSTISLSKLWRYLLFLVIKTFMIGGTWSAGSTSSSSNYFSRV